MFRNKITVNFVRKLITYNYFGQRIKCISTEINKLDTLKELMVTTERVGDVCLIGLNRPEKRNAINIDMLEELRVALDWFERQDDLPTAVLYGKGGNFSIGCDIDENDRRMVDANLANFSEFVRHKPLVAAIDGHALGSGLELACMCDLRVMEETARVGLSREKNELETHLSDWLAERLPNLIGLSRAMDLTLTGRPINGQEAFQMGLANIMVATGTAVGRATQIAGNLGRFPQAALRKDRELLYDSVYKRKGTTELYKIPKWSNQKH